MTYVWLFVAVTLAPLAFMLFCGVVVALGWLAEQAIAGWFWLIYHRD